MFGGPLDRPLTQAEWEHANRFITDLRDRLEGETQAAAGFCRELAELRIAIDALRGDLDDARTQIRIRDRRIDYLREGIRQAAYVTGNAQVRARLDDLLLHEDMPV